MFTIQGADGKAYGPVTAEKITEWIAGGRANLQTKAKRDGGVEWQTLGDFAEFSGSTIPAPPPLAPPAAPAPGPAIDAVMALASRWLRLGAVLVDSLIAGLCVSPGFGVLLAAGIFSHGHQPNAAMLAVGFGAIAVALLTLCGVQIYLLSTRGQTIGKKLLGIRIVNFDDEGNPGFVKAFLLRVFVNGLIGAVPLAGGVYSLVDICFIFREDQRCIHDLIASTKVVKA